MTPIWTPKLDAAVADYCGVMGFDVVQQITGVFALLRLGDLRLQLWQRGARPGRWEQALDVPENWRRPDHYRVVLDSPFEVYNALQSAVRAHTHSLLIPEHQRLSGPPRLQPWGTWEFTLTDADGNLLRFVQWVSSAAPTPADPSVLPLPARMRRQT
jgi:catechol 2,3-dioxygenase-like lactoylglutathione lyase family enzyme